VARALEVYEQNGNLAAAAHLRNRNKVASAI
jgi:hypothetical protein